MLVSFTHLVAILASVTLALSAGLPPVARTSSEITTSGSLSAPKANVAVARGEDIYSDDDFIGTPEEIYIKVKARRDSLGLDLPARSNSSLEARDQEWPVLCVPVANWGWGPANIYNANNCQAQLATQGRYTVGAHSCSRICCIDGDQVWLCNDQLQSINPALPYISSYIPDIVGQCGSNGLAGGQMFDSDDYNVILRGYWGLLQDCAFS